jgi:hypothetical protein
MVSPLEVAPKLRSDLELEERQRVLRRVAGLGVFAWTSFVLSDFYVSGLLAGGRNLAWLLGFRAAGTLIGAGAYVAVSRPHASAAMLDAIEVLLFVTAGVLVSLGAIRFGGIASPLVQGVSLVALVRAVLPSSGWRILCISGLTALSFPAVMGLAAIVVPEIRAQWTSMDRLAVFGNNYIFVLMGTGIAAYVGHIQWRARRELAQARRLGSFRLLLPIARGDIGELWLARQESLGRDVALRILREEPPKIARRWRASSARLRPRAGSSTPTRSGSSISVPATTASSSSRWSSFGVWTWRPS